MVNADAYTMPSQPVTRWPTTMPKLTAKHFRHGTWAGVTVVDGYPVDLDAHWHNLSRSQRETVLHNLTECGTPRCAVGNVMAAFGQDCRFTAWNASPLEDQICNKVGPVYKFIRTFAKHLGFPNIQSTWQLSAAFENKSTPVSAKKAATAWSKTITELGYTEKV